MTLVAETYLNCSIYLPAEDREELAAYIGGRSREIFQEIYAGRPGVSVKVEAGSVKIWVEAVAALAVVITGYGSFRSGIDYLVGDARKFSEAVRGVIVDVGVDSSEIAVFQRRLGVVGKIQRVLKSIERVEGSYYYDHNDRRDRLDQLKAELFEVIIELDGEKDRSLLLENLPEVIAHAVAREPAEHLPRFPRANSRLAARPRDWDPDLELLPSNEVRMSGLRALTLEPELRFDAKAGKIVGRKKVQSFLPRTTEN